ncbi:MAG: hypothetical protein ACKOEQ_02160 [Verrucomicrobiota bacterium]
MKTLIHSIITWAPLIAAMAARAEVLLDETFNYPDGPLASVSDGRWVTHSGTPGQVAVSGGGIRLLGSKTEDIRNAFVTRGVTNGTLFAGLDVRFRALPSPTGAFFFHFKDPVDSGAASVFTGRIHATTAGAGAGSLRVGIAWGTGTPVWAARDIRTNEAARLVLMLDLGATNAVLWVNPGTEADVEGRALANDGRGIGQGLSQVAFRQATGLGEVEVDRLRVGTRFEDVVDGGVPRVGVVREGYGVRAWMPATAWEAGWRMEVAGGLRGPWSQGPEMTVEGDRASVWIPNGPSMVWLRLARR